MKNSIAWWRSPAVRVIPIALSAGSAAAQSGIMLYGNLDGSIVFSRSGAAKNTSMASGVGSASFWGLRGAEDLGGGYKSLFQLEAGLEMDTGASKSFNGDYGAATPTAPNGPAGTGFNRRSHVGLETPFGTFLMGREYTPGFYTATATDTMRLQYFGNIQSVLVLTGGSERSARSSNAIAYSSPLMSGFRARAFYGLGSESAGGAGRPLKDANRLLGLGAEYNRPGLTLSGSYLVLKLPLTAGSPPAFTQLVDRRDWMVGVRYSFGSLAVSAGHFRVNAPTRGVDTWLGGSYTMGPNLISAQVQKLRQDNPSGERRRATAIGIAYAYSLSRRTTLYAAYGRTSNNATAQFGVTGNDMTFAASVRGADPTATAIGIRHTF